MSDTTENAMTPATAEDFMTTTVTATVTLDVHPRKGQSPQNAAQEFMRLFREYLERADSPFWQDYGAALEDIRAAREAGEQPVWGGYEGPFAVAVAVRDEDAVHQRAVELADPNDTGVPEPLLMEEALAQARAEWENLELRPIYYPDS